MPTDSNTDPQRDADRLLWGAKDIGAEVDRTPRQAFHLLEQGHLPGWKVGRRWVSTPRKLRAFLAGSSAERQE